MRGDDDQHEGMFSYISPEKRVPTDHPLRLLRKILVEILKEMSPKFQKLYSKVGRPSIAPERLLRSRGSGQELRHAEIRSRTAGDEHHPACGAEHDQSEERGGRANHAACRV
jgi:hypothetical protein